MVANRGEMGGAQGKATAPHLPSEQHAPLPQSNIHTADTHRKHGVRTDTRNNARPGRGSLQPRATAVNGGGESWTHSRAHTHLGGLAPAVAAVHHAGVATAVLARASSIASLLGHCGEAGRRTPAGRTHVVRDGPGRQGGGVPPTHQGKGVPSPPSHVAAHPHTSLSRPATATHTIKQTRAQKTRAARGGATQGRSQWRPGGAHWCEGAAFSLAAGEQKLTWREVRHHTRPCQVTFPSHRPRPPAGPLQEAAGPLHQRLWKPRVPLCATCMHVFRRSGAFACAIHPAFAYWQGPARREVRGCVLCVHKRCGRPSGSPPWFASRQHASGMLPCLLVGAGCTSLPDAPSRRPPPPPSPKRRLHNGPRADSRLPLHTAHSPANRPSPTMARECVCTTEQCLQWCPPPRVMAAARRGRRLRCCSRCPTAWLGPPSCTPARSSGASTPGSCAPPPTHTHQPSRQTHMSN
jgi:hypothetical protein